MSESTAPELDNQYIIATLLEENRAMNDNRLYLLAAIKQLQAEFLAAKQLWETEKESLKSDA